jgi:nuclear pore complex protein Nup155
MKKLVSTTQGARLAGALIEAMMSHMMAHARHSAEDLATELQKGCPDFFGADSRTFYHARDLLQLARDARALAKRTPFATST